MKHLERGIIRCLRGDWVLVSKTSYKFKIIAELLHHFAPTFCSQRNRIFCCLHPKKLHLLSLSKVSLTQRINRKSKICHGIL